MLATEQTGLLKKSQVRKPTGAIHASNKFSLVQGKAINVLLKNALPDLKKKETYTINLARLMKDIGYTSRNTREFKESIMGLISTVVEWNVLGKDSKNEWTASSLLASAKINKNGTLEYAYSPHLRQMFEHQYLYANLDLIVQNSFTKKHSLKLWETLIDALCVSKTDEAWTPWISINQYRKLMGVRENEHKEFKMLNNRIIKEPLKEINEVSDVIAKVEYKKEKRKCSAVRFYVKRKISMADLHKHIANDSAGQELFTRLVKEFGLSEKYAAKILTGKPVEKITSILKTVDKQIEQGGIKNIPAFVKTALENEWQDYEDTHKATEIIEEDDDKDWMEIKKILKDKYGDDIYKSWFMSLRFHKKEYRQVSLRSTNRFVAKTIEDKYGAAVLQLWQNVDNSIEKVNFIVL